MSGSGDAEQRGFTGRYDNVFGDDRTLQTRREVKRENSLDLG